MKIVITDNPDKSSNDAILANGISFDEFWKQYICPNTEYEELGFYDEPLAIKTYESIYIKKPFMVKDVIEVICSFEKGEDDYDVIANAGYGQTSSMARRDIVGKKGIWKVSPDCIDHEEISEGSFRPIWGVDDDSITNTFKETFKNFEI